MYSLDPAPEARLCPHCGSRSRTSDYCSSCSRPLSPRPPSSVPGVGVGHGDGSELANWLTALSWFILIGGLIGALWFWLKFGTTRGDGIFAPAEERLSGPMTMVALSIAASSIVWHALLSGVAFTVRSTIDLKRQVSGLAKQAPRTVPAPPAPSTPAGTAA